MTAVNAVIVLECILFAEALSACLQDRGRISCEIVPLAELLEPTSFVEADRREIVILLELSGNGRDNSLVLQRARKRWPSGRSILFTKHPGADEVAELFSQGAWGVFSPGESLDVLRKAVLSVCSGEIWVCRQDSSRIIRHLRGAGPKREEPGETTKTLSRREEQVLSLVAGGLKNRQIADRLCISEQTVKVHLNAIFRKIGVKDRLQAALFAIDRGLTPGKVPGG